MKPDKLHDALNHLDDDLIEAADKIRSAPKPIRTSHTHAFAVAACAVMVAAATLVILKLMPPMLNTSSDGAHITKSTGDINEMATDINKTDDGDAVPPDDQAVDVTENGVTIPKTVITENTLGEYFCYEGRIYVPYQEISGVELNDIIGDEIGTLNNVFKEKPHGDYLADFSTNMEVGDKVFTLKGYDKEFMLAVWLDTHFHLFINDNGITLEKGSDILVDRLNLVENYSALRMSISGSPFYQETVPSYEYEPINDYLELFYDAPVVPQTENENFFIEATLTFTLSSGVDVRILLYENNFICVEMGELSSVCLKADTGKLNHTIFDNFIEYLKSISFASSYERLDVPTPEIEEYMFCHRIFASNVVLYFCSDAHIWPEELMNEPIRYDKTSLKVYYTNDYGKSVGTVMLPLPEDFDTSYDHIIPVYSGSGGGSGEFEVIYRVEYGEDVRYISFNNFAWSSKLLELQYGGEVSEERMKELREISTQDVHVYDLLTEIIPEITEIVHGDSQSTGVPVGIYRLNEQKIELIAVVDYFLADNYAAVLKVIGVTQGRNYSYTYPDALRFASVTNEKLSPNDTYFVHTNEGDLILTYDETVNVLSSIDLTKNKHITTPIHYNIEVHANEHISDNEHNRDVNIIKINADSAHIDTMGQTVTREFDIILDKYMASAPYEHQYLAIDSTYSEVGDFLCVAVVASIPSQYTLPYYSQYIYWNRAEDKLYSLAEYLDVIGIDSLSSIGDAVQEKLGDAYTHAVLGMFYLNGDIYFVVHVYSTFENGVNSAETMFYNYSTSELILGTDFSGFASLGDK